jgi:hypothetical protein
VCDPVSESLPSRICRDHQPEWRTDIDEHDADHIRKVYVPGRECVVSHARKRESEECPSDHAGWYGQATNRRNDDAQHCKHHEPFVYCRPVSHEKRETEQETEKNQVDDAVDEKSRHLRGSGGIVDAHRMNGEQSAEDNYVRGEDRTDPSHAAMKIGSTGGHKHNLNNNEQGDERPT